VLAAFGNTTEDNEASEEEEVVVALMASSELDSDDEQVHSLAQLKEKVCGPNKVKLEELLFTFMDECDAINAKYCKLKEVCSNLKRDVRKLEHANEILESERLKVDEKTFICMKTLIN